MPIKSGFTLIELLVVMTIIALLSTVGLVLYTNVIKNSRDSKRLSDLKLIQSALEDYNSDLLFYPTTGLILSSVVTFDSNTGRGSGTAPLTKKTYLNTVPKDPTVSTSTPYVYTTTANCDNSAAKLCTTYCIYANMEGSGYSIPSACSTSPPPGYDFAVSPP